MFVLLAFNVILSSPRGMLSVSWRLLFLLWFIETSLLSHIIRPCGFHQPYRLVPAQSQKAYFPARPPSAHQSDPPAPLLPPLALQYGSRHTNFGPRRSALIAASSNCGSAVPAAAGTHVLSSASNRRATTAPTCSANHPRGHSPHPCRTSMFASRHPNPGIGN